MAESLESDKPSYHVPALEKGLDILEFLAAASVPQTQAEVARALGRSSSEIFRMLGCLEGRGYLIRDAYSSRYSLSLRLFEMAQGHSLVDRLLQVARGPMRDVAEGIRESVHLSILQGDELLILAQEESPEPIRLSINIGTRQPILKTASGRLLLAHLDESKRQAFLDADAFYRGMTVRAQKSLQDSLQRARGDGFVVADSQVTSGVRDISVLIGAPRLELMAALATPVLVLLGDLPDTVDILDTLKEKADLITQKMGLNLEHAKAVKELQKP